MKPIIFVHGYSAEGRDNKVEDIYRSFPADVRNEFGEETVLVINLSRWISLSGSIVLDDISFAKEQTLNSDHFHHLKALGSMLLSIALMLLWRGTGAWIFEDARKQPQHCLSHSLMICFSESFLLKQQ